MRSLISIFSTYKWVKDFKSFNIPSGNEDISFPWSDKTFKFIRPPNAFFFMHLIELKFKILKNTIHNMKNKMTESDEIQ